MENIIYKIKKTMKEMYEDRLYTNIEFYDNYNEDIFSPIIKSNEAITYVYFNKVGKGEITTFLENNTDEHIIIVSKYNLSSHAKTYINNYCAENNTVIEFFLHSECCFNKLKHVLQPKYTLLSSDNINKLMNELQIKKIIQLPKILKTDPVCKYLNLKTKDVLMIERYNGISYRVVI